MEMKIDLTQIENLMAFDEALDTLTWAAEVTNFQCVYLVQGKSSHLYHLFAAGFGDMGRYVAAILGSPLYSNMGHLWVSTEMTPLEFQQAINGEIHKVDPHIRDVLLELI